MYENPKFNENNEKILCEMNGKNANMLMDIKTKALKAGESFTVCDANNETAILLLSGDVTYKFDGKEEKGKRANQFVDRPYCVHFSRNNERNALISQCVSYLFGYFFAFLLYLISSYFSSQRAATSGE